MISQELSEACLGNWFLSLKTVYRTTSSTWESDWVARTCCSRLRARLFLLGCCLQLRPLVRVLALKHGLNQPHRGSQSSYRLHLLSTTAATPSALCCRKMVVLSVFSAMDSERVSAVARNSVPHCLTIRYVVRVC